MKIRNVKVRDIGDMWVMEWEEQGKDTKWKWYSRSLYQIDTEEEAKKDVVEYFGGLVTIEQVNEMKIELKIDNLKIQESNNRYHVVHPTEDGEHVYTVAIISPTKEGCDMTTVGMRPWEMKGTTPEQFMNFCKVAMDLIDKLIAEEKRKIVDFFQ